MQRITRCCIFGIIAIFIALSGVFLFFKSSIKPCKNGDAVPNVIFGPYYVIVGSERLFLGQAYTFQEEYIWMGTARLIGLTSNGATFLITRPSFVEELEKSNVISCTTFISKSDIKKSADYYETKDPTLLSRFVFEPDEIKDPPWRKETYRFRTNGLVTWRSTPYFDKAKAIVSSEKVSAFDMDQTEYSPSLRAEQTIYSYTSKELAEQAFIEDTWLANLDEHKELYNFESLIEKQQAFIGFLGKNWYCIYRATEKQYMIELLVIEKDQISTERDCLELVTIVQKKMILPKVD